MFGILTGFMMVLTRTSAFFLVAPVFSWKTIPARVKIAMTVMLSLLFWISMPAQLDSDEISMLHVVLLLSVESTYGFAMGLIVVLVFTAVKFSGRIIEQQMGLTMAKVIDPFSGEGGQPLGTLLEMIFILVFLSANGHHLLLAIISDSYESFPAGNIPTIPVLTVGIIKSGSILLMGGLRLAAPMLAAFLLLKVSLAILARLTPEMNIFLISFPISIGLGLIMTAMFLPFIISFMTEFSDWIGKLLPH